MKIFSPIEGEELFKYYAEPKCEFCNDTGKILVSSTNSDEDLKEEFCSCEKGRSLLNTLAYNE